MAGPNLLTIPAKLRTMILRSLFQKSKLRITTDEEADSVMIHDFSLNAEIIYTCRQIYSEARPILASSMKVTFDFTTPRSLPKPIQTFFYPLLRRINVGYYQSEPELNLKGFRSLQQLEIGHSSACDEFEKYQLENVHGEKVSEALLSGALDEELKKAAKEHYLKNSKWVKRHFLDETRSFKIIGAVRANGGERTRLHGELWCVPSSN
jgi:hypothetical protein